jgi:hypothetical protein
MDAIWVPDAGPGQKESEPPVPGNLIDPQWND